MKKNYFSPVTSHVELSAGCVMSTIPGESTSVGTDNDNTAGDNSPNPGKTQNGTWGNVWAK